MTEASRDPKWNRITHRPSHDLSDNNAHPGVECNCLLSWVSPSTEGMIDESLTGSILQRRKAITSLSCGGLKEDSKENVDHCREPKAHKRPNAHYNYHWRYCEDERGYRNTFLLAEC